MDGAKVFLMFKKKLISLHNRYIPALTLIAIFSTLAFINVQDIMHSIENDGKLINMSGRQRMLSQSIVLNSQEYIKTKEMKVHKILQDEANLMHKEHQYLIKNPLSLELHTIYYDEKLNKDINNFLANVNRILLTNEESLLPVLQHDSKNILPRLNKAVELYEKENKEKLMVLKDKEKYLYFLTLVTLLFEAIFIFYPASKKIQKSEEELKIEVFKKTKELENLNQNLLKKVAEEVEKNREKEQKLYEQEKMTQMMEMIGNIAHHWRQPLSIISTATSGMQLQKKYQILNDESFEEATANILQQSEDLSKTIEQFTHYINLEDIQSSFSLEQHLIETLDIVDFTLKNFGIELITDIKQSNVEIYSNKTHISQVLLNIIYNARDILIERNIKTPKVYITLEKIDNNFLISIEDNGGGIKENDLKKVFEPYFTTKHKSIGTGLGLNICYSIVTIQLKGNIFVKNSSKGALFTILLPTSL